MYFRGFFDEFYHWYSFWINQELLLWCRNNLVWQGYHDWQKAFWRSTKTPQAKLPYCQEHFLSYHFCEACKSMISWIYNYFRNHIDRKTVLYFFWELVNWICIVNLLILDNREMGLQFLGYSFSHFLCIGMFATFRKSGNIPLLKGIVGMLFGPIASYLL